MHRLRILGIFAALALLIAACGGPTPPAGTHALTVTIVGDGQVTFDSSGENAEGTNNVAAGDVTLVASANPGSTFVGWTGEKCSGGELSCTFTLDGDTEITATFAPEADGTHTLTVATAGDGTGTVEFDTAGGEDAVGTTEIDDGAEVTLVATATTGEFVGWTGGACDGQTTNACSFTMDADATITANFNAPGGGSFDLTVAIDAAGTSAGGVTFGPGGEDAVGTNTFDEGTLITLVASATSGSFAGWAGDVCVGSGASCTFTITANTDVTANFTDAAPGEGEIAVNASADDGIEWVTPANTGEDEHGIGYTHNSLEYAGLPYTNRYEAVTMAGFAFRDLGIPAGSIVTEAYIQFTSIIRTGNAAHIPSDNSTEIKLLIAAEANPNPAEIPHQTNTAPLSSRPTVAATQTWVVPDWVNKGEKTDLQKTPDLSALLNDLIAAGGWDETSDVMFIIENDDADATVGWRQVATFDEGIAAAPVLHFTYTTP